MIFLSKYEDIDNIELKNIISSYQDYFIFLNKNSTIQLFLDVKKLKYYLLNGLEIKYRDYIFLFLRNNIDSNIIKSNIIAKNNLTLNLNIDNILFNINDNNINFLNKNDYNNLNYIINLSNNIIMKNNNFSLNDKNIIKLDNNFYADIILERFYFNKPKKITNSYNFIIINYFNEIKNKIITALSINNYDNNVIIDNNFTKIEDKTYQLNTKCNLILTNKKNIKLWILLINTYFPNNKILAIEQKRDLENIKNKDIINYNFLVLNTNILSNKFYLNYFKKYLSTDNNLYISIVNSFYDNIKNLFILEENVQNFHLFNWNNIIYDEINEILILNNKLIDYLTTKNVKYYLQSNKIELDEINYIIKNNFDNNSNNFNNYYSIIPDILLIKNEEKFIYNNIEKIYIDIELSDIQNTVYNIFFKIYNFDNFDDFDNFDNFDNINNTDNINNANKYKKMCLYFFQILNHNFNFTTVDELSLIINEYYDTLIKNENLTDKISLLLIKKLYVKNIIENFKNNLVKRKCSICIEKIENNNYCILRCGHYFCKECISEYISANNSINNIYSCPNCRDKFKTNNIYYINLLNNNNDNDNDNNINCCNNEITCCNKSNKINLKLKKILEIIHNDENNNNNNNNKIIILSQFTEILSKIENIFIEHNIEYNNLLNKQKKVKRKNSKIDNIIYISNYDSILKNSNLNIFESSFSNNSNEFTQKIYGEIITKSDELFYNNKNKIKIILLDYPEINNINHNLYDFIKNIYYKSCENINFSLYFLYYKNTIEEYIINKFYKENEKSKQNEQNEQNKKNIEN
jgi:hypothetical protein